MIETGDGVGTPLERREAAYTYNAAGKKLTLTDARGFKAGMTYDGFGRQQRWIFPSKSATDTVNGTATSLDGDYEQYRYDIDGNRTSLRKRDGSTLTYQYDALNRVTVKIVPERADLTPAQTLDVYYDYDLRGLQTKARFGSLAGEGVTTSYDGFGRVTSSTVTLWGVSRTLTYLYDAGGKRTRITHPDGKAFGYYYDGLGRMTYVHDKASISGPDDYVARYFYKPEGPRYTAIRGVGTGGFTTVHHYDHVQRPTLMGNDLAGTANDMTVTLAYNPAGQIRQYDRDANAYAWTGSKSVSRNYAVNGQNQYSSAGEASFDYDLNGNLKSSVTPTRTANYVYDVENRLVSASGTDSAFLVYDPLGRLLWFSSPNTGMTQFLYDGDALVAEYNGAGTLTRRYVHGPGTDDPVAVYEGAALGLAGRRYMLPDERGSIAALVDANGSPVAINTYDEHGIPGANNQGRFQYTGQAWIGELGLYYYKARFYSPYLGRFLQVDPVGYKDQINLYAYVGNDPINHSDPSGLTCTRNEDGKGVTCKVDEPGNLSAKALNKANSAYTRAVNRLLYNPNKRMVLQARDSRDNTVHTVTTAGKIAESLMQANVYYAGDSPQKESLGGSKATAQTRGTVGTPGGVHIGLYTEGLRQSAQGLGKTVIHEGAHGTTANAQLREKANPGTFNLMHQDSFKSGAAGLYDNYEN